MKAVLCGPTRWQELLGCHLCPLVLLCWLVSVEHIFLHAQPTRRFACAGKLSSEVLMVVMEVQFSEGYTSTGKLAVWFFFSLIYLFTY